MNDLFHSDHPSDFKNCLPQLCKNPAQLVMISRIKQPD